MNRSVIETSLIGAKLFLNAEIFCGWLERHPVNPLFGQLHGIKADAADEVALLLHGDVKPVLLIYCVAFPLSFPRADPIQASCETQRDLV